MSNATLLNRICWRVGRLKVGQAPRSTGRHGPDRDGTSPEGDLPQHRNDIIITDEQQRHHITLAMFAPGPSSTYFRRCASRFWPFVCLNRVTHYHNPTYQAA